jgi:hypothetical protein
MRYRVLDIRTREVLGTYKTRASARRKADSLDLEYGAIRCSVEAIGEVAEPFESILTAFQRNLQSEIERGSR